MTFYIFSFIGLYGLTAILYSVIDLFRKTERSEGVMHKQDGMWGRF